MANHFNPPCRKRAHASTMAVREYTQQQESKARVSRHLHECILALAGRPLGNLPPMFRSFLLSLGLGLRLGWLLTITDGLGLLRNLRLLFLRLQVARVCMLRTQLARKLTRDDIRREPEERMPHLGAGDAAIAPGTTCAPAAHICPPHAQSCSSPAACTTDCAFQKMVRSLRSAAGNLTTLEGRANHNA